MCKVKEVTDYTERMVNTIFDIWRLTTENHFVQCKSPILESYFRVPHIYWLKTGQLGKMGYPFGNKDVTDLQLECISRLSASVRALG